jgi:hypothetical protein
MVYYASRINVAFWSLFWFALAVCVTFLLGIISTASLVFACVFSVIFLLLYLKENITILLKNPVLLEFGPSGIGGYRLNGLIPWGEIADLVMIQRGSKEECSYHLDIYLRSGGAYNRMQEDPRAQKKCYRIPVGKINEMSNLINTPDLHKIIRLYRRLLESFTYYTESVPLQGAFKFANGNEIFLQFNSEGVGGGGVGSVIPWCDIKDILILRNEFKSEGGLNFGEFSQNTRIVFDLHTGAASKNFVSHLVTGSGALNLRLDGNLSEPDVLRASRDFLLAFSKYSEVDVAEKVGKRLQRLFSEKN